jgi:predicted permease
MHSTAATPARLLAEFLHDLRLGLRTLQREPGFSTLAILILGLGIAAVATQFAVVDGALLRGFDFRAADRLVSVELVNPENRSSTTQAPLVTRADFADLSARQTCFESFVGYLNMTGANLSVGGVTQRRNAGYISHDFFRALGVAPALGRDFTPEDDQPGSASAVILADSLWKSDFGSRPDIVGQSVRLNGRAATVVGVMPAGFVFPWSEQLWTPMHVEFPVRPRHERAPGVVSIIAHLKPGVSLGQAEAEIRALATTLAAEHPENRDRSLGRVRPLIESFAPAQLRGVLCLLLCFAAGVLLIACVNVALMQFARATARAREFALRTSLGAARGRLVRQLLTENLLLAVGGAVPGILLAQWAVAWIDTSIRQFSNSMPAWMHFSINGAVLAGVVAATFLATLLAGVLPALFASRTRPASVLGTSSRGFSTRNGWISRSLIAGQIALTCLLLIGSVLQLRSILRQQSLDYGYDTGGLLSARIGLMAGSYPTNEARIAFHERLLRELRASPAITQAAFSDRYRMTLLDGVPIEIGSVSGTTRSTAIVERITDGYLATLGQRLLEGRDFSATDSDPAQPVAIVNASFARKHFGTTGAIGQRFRPINPDSSIEEPWRIIVGVVSDVRMAGPFDQRADNSGFYVPFTVAAPGNGQLSRDGLKFATVILQPRGKARPESLIPVLQQVVGALDPDLPVYYVGTPRSQLDGFLGQVRLTTAISLAVGLLAVCLAAAGLYGVTAYSVSRRQREFGIRLALGAQRHQLFAPVLRQAAGQIAVGLTLGLILTFFGVKLAVAIFGDFLFGISPSDPLTYIAVPLLLVAVSLAATFVPARRATRVDPTVALRAE